MLRWAAWARDRAATVQSHVMCTFAPWCRHPGAFSFGGRELTYVRRPYNRTWLNERSVEVPIALDFLADEPPDRVLEVGNVLAHYGVTGHTVVDKYERAPGVINEDIVAWEAAHQYAAIVSISTLEHVGWDEEPREPQKVLVAVDRLRALLAPGGRMLVTVPIGHNPVIDERLAQDRLGFTQADWLVRGPKNTWSSTSAETALTTRYLRERGFAAAIFVGQTQR